jgi:hypothetical protein
VLERLATWQEIRMMTIDDVDLLNIAADEWRAAEIRASKDRR